MADIDLLAPIPSGKEHNTLKFHIRNLARKIARQALLRNEDVLMEVYCAGLYHGAALTKGAGDDAG